MKGIEMGMDREMEITIFEFISEPPCARQCRRRTITLVKLAGEFGIFRSVSESYLLSFAFALKSIRGAIASDTTSPEVEGKKKNPSLIYSFVGSAQLAPFGSSKESGSGSGWCLEPGIPKFLSATAASKGHSRRDSITRKETPTQELKSKEKNWKRVW